MKKIALFSLTFLCFLSYSFSQESNDEKLIKEKNYQEIKILEMEKYIKFHNFKEVILGQHNLQL